MRSAMNALRPARVSPEQWDNLKQHALEVLAILLIAVLLSLVLTG